MDSGELVDRWRRLPPELRHRPWFRCESPERPPDPQVRWHYDGCAGCRLALRVLLADSDNTPWERDRLAWLADRMGVEP